MLSLLGPGTHSWPGHSCRHPSARAARQVPADNMACVSKSGPEPTCAPGLQRRARLDAQHALHWDSRLSRRQQSTFCCIIPELLFSACRVLRLRNPLATACPCVAGNTAVQRTCSCIACTAGAARATLPRTSRLDNKVIPSHVLFPHEVVLIRYSRLCGRDLAQSEIFATSCCCVRPPPLPQHYAMYLRWGLRPR